MLVADREHLGGRPRLEESKRVARLLASAHEHRALGVSISLAVLFAALLSSVTLGVFGLLVGWSILGVFFSRVHARASMMRTSPERYAVIHSLSLVAAFRLATPPVEVYIRQSPDLNAFATGVGQRSLIVLESGLVDALTPAELLFVLGHEAGHVRQRHVLWRLLMGLGGASNVPLASRFFRLVFSGWSRAAELTSDRAGLIAAGALEPSLRALIKITVGTRTATQVSTSEFLASFQTQHELLDAAAELLRSHPLASRRISALQEFWGMMNAQPATEGA